MKPLRIYIKTIFLFTFLILSIGCASLQDTSLSQIGNRHVESILKGSGQPTIVFETGMGPTINTWGSLLDSLAQYSKVYAYNRPGYGKSGLQNPPINVKEVAYQLHSNLTAQHISPPYILVGHSAGGLYINMFARLYPEEVAGVVLLDASHPEQFEYFRTDHPFIYNLLVTSTKKGTRQYELEIIKNAKSDFYNAPQFPQIPISVLTAGKKNSIFENKKLRAQWLKFQTELANLSVHSNHIIVEHSGHYIHQDAQELVISEIKRIIAMKKRGHTID